MQTVSGLPSQRECGTEEARSHTQLEKVINCSEMPELMVKVVNIFLDNKKIVPIYSHNIYHNA